MKPAYFWATSAATAVGVGALVAIAFPFSALGLETLDERQRAWLLAVWTVGVLAICFGVSGLMGGLNPLGFRDVAEAGSVTAAIEARREANKQRDKSFYNFAGWTVSTGGFLLLVYFVGWIVSSSG